MVSALLGEELTGGMIKVIEESLKAVDSQQANTEKYSSLDKGPATYSVVKRARDNDADLHSNNTVCSLSFSYNNMLLPVGVVFNGTKVFLCILIVVLFRLSYNYSFCYYRCCD